MVLEDESGRIALGGSKLGAEVPHLVTGVVVAMKGTIDDRGVLDVSTKVTLILKRDLRAVIRLFNAELNSPHCDCKFS